MSTQGFRWSVLMFLALIVSCLIDGAPGIAIFRLVALACAVAGAIEIRAERSRS